MPLPILLFEENEKQFFFIMFYIPSQRINESYKSQIINAWAQFHKKIGIPAEQFCISVGTSAHRNVWREFEFIRSLLCPLKFFLQ